MKYILQTPMINTITRNKMEIFRFLSKLYKFLKRKIPIQANLNFFFDWQQCVIALFSIFTGIKTRTKTNIDIFDVTNTRYFMQ